MEMDGFFKARPARLVKHLNDLTWTYLTHFKYGNS